MGGHPQHTYGPLTGFTESRGIVFFKKKELQVVAAAVGWPLLQALHEATAKQLQAEERVKNVEEEVRLEGDL